MLSQIFFLADPLTQVVGTTPKPRYQQLAARRLSVLQEFGMKESYVPLA